MAVRNEKVILSLQDDFSTPMARAAAAAALANKELRDLSGTSVKASKDSDGLSKSTKKVGDETEKTTKKVREYTLEMAVADERAKRLRSSLREQASSLVDVETAADRTGDAFRKGSADINQFSGRLRLLTEAAVIGVPGLLALGATAVPATVALAAGLGAAGGALGVLLLGFNGLGDALEAIDTARLEPTVENLQAMRDELEKLGPAGAGFARYLTSLRPELERLQVLSREGMFPGYRDGLDELLKRLPEVQRIAFEIADTLGDLGADAGASLAGPRFEAFFDYLETDAAPTLEAFARSTGNVIEGLANLLVAFAPLTADFTGGMERMTRSFANWSAGLSETDGFRSFVGYLRDTGPQVLDLLGSLASAFVDIARASAPVGSAVLTTLTALAKVLSLIAGSPIGPPLFTAAVAMLALSRATKIANAAMLSFSGTTAAGAANVAKLKAGLNLAAILAGIWAVDAAMDKVFGDRSVDGDNLLGNLTNLASSDAAAELDKIGRSVRDINSSMGEATNTAFGFLPGDTTWSEARDNIEKVDEALASLVEGGNAEQAADAMAEIVKSAQAQGISVAETTKWFKEYNEALDGAQAVDDAAAAQKRYNDALGASSRVLGITKAQVAGLTERMEEQRTAALGAFDAVTQYASALINARKQAEKSNAGIEISNDMTRKQKLEVIANRGALSQLAAAWNNQREAVRNNVGEWREARGQFIDTAVSMGATAGQARRLANDVYAIPKQRAIDIKMYGSEAAANQLERIRSAVTSIPREWSTRYYVNQVNSISRPRGPVAQADGGFVPKTGLPYADRHPYLLADGEGVTTNRRGETDRFRDVVGGINAGLSRSQIKGMLADGGFAGRDRADFGDGIGIPRPNTLAEAVAAIAELRGTIRGLNAGIKESERTIRRETKERDRLSSIVDKNQDEVDRLTGLFNDMSSSVMSGLAANQFEKGDPWKSGGGLAGILEKLNASTANADAMITATGTLDDSLTGEALKSVLEQGLETSQMFAGLSPEDLAKYQATFDANAAALTKAGAVAGSAYVGEPLGAANQVLAESKAELREQTVELRTQTVELRALNRKQERSENLLGQVKDALGDIRSELKKNRGEVESGARGKR